MCDGIRFYLFQEGWTKYNSDGSNEPVAFPNDDALVLDVEICVSEGQHPTLATAASPAHWYSWCSSELVSSREPDKDRPDLGNRKRPKRAKSTAPDVLAELGLTSRRRYATNVMIPVESRRDATSLPTSARPKLIVGHNVAFDRARIKEQYWVDVSMATPGRCMIVTHKNEVSSYYQKWLANAMGFSSSTKFKQRSAQLVPGHQVLNFSPNDKNFVFMVFASH